MSEKKIQETKSRLIRARDAYHVLTVVLTSWAKTCIDSMTVQSNGRSGVELADVTYGRAHVNSWSGPRTVDDADSNPKDWIFSRSKRTTQSGGSAQPRSNLVGSVMVAEGEGIGTWLLLPLDRAALWLETECKRVALKVKIEQERATIANRTGRYRQWLHWTRCQAEMEGHLEWGLELLKALCLTQARKPRGPQVVQTRREIKADYYKEFSFCGNPAMMLPPGRIPLTHGEWLRRYRARKLKAKKTNRVRKNDKRKGRVNVPKTKHGRPSREVREKIADLLKPDRSPSFTYADDFDATPYLDDFNKEIA